MVFAPNRPRFPRAREEDTGGMSERVVFTRRISKVVKGGRRLRFNALVVVGEGEGVVGPWDSGFVLARFGCPVGTGDPSCDAADQNGDGVVDPLDSGFVLARFGVCP